MLGLAATVGVAASLTITSSWLFLVILVGAAFLLGLEAIEPLAQEVDHPDLTDGLPVPRGWLFAHHLVAPAGLLVVAALFGATAAAIVEPSHAAAAFALAIPVAWAGAIGAVVTTVRDAPELPAHVHTTITGADRGADNPFSMPEFSGFSSVGAGALPVLLSAIAAGPVAAMRVAPGASTVGRSILGVALCLVVMTWWVVRNDQWTTAVRRFFLEGRAAQPGAST